MNARLRRTASALAVATALLGSLAACYVGPGAVDCDAAAPSGTSSNSIEATGAVLSTPTVSFPTPLRPKKTEATTLVEGKGEPIRSDQYVSAYLTLVDGTTGEVLGQSEYTSSGAASFSIDAAPVPGLDAGLACAKVGSRVAVVVPGSTAFAKSAPPAGVSKDDALVAVVDVKDAYLAHAEGLAQVTEPGMPSVVLAPSGQPGITVPQADPPAKLRVAKLIAGDGATVKDGDSVLFNYTGVIWKTGKVFESSWDTGQPITITVADGQAIPGFVSALKGSKVGDQILAVIPPDQAYGDQANGTVPAGSTLVFVIDVLGIVQQ